MNNKKYLSISGAIICSFAVGTFLLAETASKNCLPLKETKRCLVFPGTCCSVAEVNDIINGLRKNHDRAKNYKVCVWDKGKKSIEMGEMKIEPATLSEAEQFATVNGLTAVTIQVGVCKAPANTAFRIQKAEPDELVEELRTIVKKYDR
jgi:hypothetical protein